MLGENETIVCTQCDAQFLLSQAEDENWEYCPCCGETYLEFDLKLVCSFLYFLMILVLLKS